MEQTDNLCNYLRQWAADYHTARFIADDPVQFPHRYTRKEDIEISGLLTAMLSFGNRKQILKKADELDELMEHAPLNYLLSGQWCHDFRADDGRSFYRMLSYAKYRLYFELLQPVYVAGHDLEWAVNRCGGDTPMLRLCRFLNVSGKSPQKKLNMFLRWMVRRNSEVDFGIWQSMSPADLIIPLDTHVCRIAFRLGLTESATYSLSAACRITKALSRIFPDDPCLGDFALFGYGVNHP